jgi:hypothetical protein
MAAAAEATSTAVSNAAEAMATAQYASRMDLLAAQLNFSDFNSSWRQQVFDSASNLSSTVSSISANISKVPTSASALLGTALLAQIIRDWSWAQDQNVGDMIRLPEQVNGQLQALQSMVQGSASHSSAIISIALEKIKSMIDQFDNIRVTADTLAAYPLTTTQTLMGIRRTISDLEKSARQEVQTEIGSILDQRKAQAAENVLTVYNNLVNLVGRTQAKSLKLASSSRR